jgi:hypothetical protein
MSRDELQVLADTVKKLDAIDASDPEKAHSEADQALLTAFAGIAPIVVVAYTRVMGRCDWWATS